MSSTTINVRHSSWINDFSRGLEAPLLGNDLDIPIALGSGKVSEFRVESGFSLFFGEMELENQFEIVSEPSIDKEGFSIIFKYIQRGSSFFKPIEGDYQEVKAGGVQFLSTDVQNHLIFPSRSHAFIFRIYITMDWIHENLQEFIKQDGMLEQMIYGPKSVMHFEPLTNRFLRLFKDVFESQFDPTLTKLIVKDKGYEAIVLFFDHYLKKFIDQDLPYSKYSISDQKRLYSLIDFIKQNLNKNLNLDLLAREVGFSKTKLQSMFHYFFHQSTYSFIKDFKLDKSIELLMKSEADITMIAHQLGYNSSTHFINIFKKHFGLSPKRFKKEHLKNVGHTAQDGRQQEQQVFYSQNPKLHINMGGRNI
jgi:AraC-like DNA-binding protein